MRRWGDGERFRATHRGHPRARSRTPTFRSNFIVGYPGETEEDHDRCWPSSRRAQLDWCGFFAFSRGGRHPRRRPRRHRRRRADGRAAARSWASSRTASPPSAGHDLIGARVEVLVDDARAWAGRYREAPEIDGVVQVPDDLPVRGVRNGRRRRRPGPGPGAPSGGAPDGASGCPTRGDHRRRCVLGPEPAVDTAYGPSAIAHAGQLRHRHPAAGLADPVRPDRRRQGASWLTFALWVVLAATDGVDGWIARRHGTTRSGRLPRPAGRQGPRPRGHGHAGRRSACSGGCRSRSSPPGRSASRCYRIQYGRRGLAIPATQGGQAQDARPGPRRRHRAAGPAAPRTSDWLAPDPAVDRRGAHRSSPAGSTSGRAAG